MSRFVRAASRTNIFAGHGSGLLGLLGRGLWPQQYRLPLRVGETRPIYIYISIYYLCTAPGHSRVSTIAEMMCSARCPSNGPWCHSLPLFPSHWLEPSRVFPVSFPRRRSGSSMAKVLMAAAIAAPPAARPSPLPLPPWALSPAPPFPPPALLG